MSGLHEAVSKRDLALVKSLIETGDDFDLRDAEGCTPLHHAIERASDDIALLLLGSGADPALRFFTDPDNPDDAGVNALHWAAAHGRLAVIDAIIDRGGVDINSMCAYQGHRRYFRGPAVIFALAGTWQGTPKDIVYPEAALSLLEAGADPNVEDNNNRSILDYCVWRYEGDGKDDQRLQLARAALDNGASMDVFIGVCNTDMQPLHCAIYSRFFKCAQLLIEYGAPVNLPEPRVGTVGPLFLAAHVGAFDIFELLMQNGADIHAKDLTGNTILHYCVGHGRHLTGDWLSAAAAPAALAIMQVAFKAGLDVEIEGDNWCDEVHYKTKFRPLHAACWYGQRWAIAPLLEAGADVNALAGGGFTPLMIVCDTWAGDERVEIVRTLLGAGADPHHAWIDPDFEGPWDSDDERDGSEKALERIYYMYSHFLGKEQYGRPYDLPGKYRPELKEVGITIGLLFVAGDRRSQFIPSPCIGLETALVPMWQLCCEDPDAAADLSVLFQHLEPSVQARIRTTLLTFHRFCPNELRLSIMADILA